MKAFRTTGAAASLLALFLSVGGHWAVLQSVAYTRMLTHFAQEDSWCVAVKKTFDGRHNCPLCPKIRAGYTQQQKPAQIVNGERSPEFLSQSCGSPVFTPALAADIPFVPVLEADFSKAPPTPPPRVA